MSIKLATQSLQLDLFDYHDHRVADYHLMIADLSLSSRQ